MKSYTWVDIEKLTTVDQTISACFDAAHDRPREHVLIRMVVELAAEKERLLGLLMKAKITEPFIIKLEK